MNSTDAQGTTANRSDTTIIDNSEVADSETNKTPNFVKTHITVKEAAQRLQASLSKVYRLDRNSGPFPIVKKGWHVLIELAGFESFLAGNSCQSPSNSELPVACGSDAPQSSARRDNGTESTVGSITPDGNPIHSGVDQPWKIPMAPPNGSGTGQRDLLSGWAYLMRFS